VTFNNRDTVLSTIFWQFINGLLMEKDLKNLNILWGKGDKPIFYCILNGAEIVLKFSIIDRKHPRA
jgi:hypothetical protein